MFRVTSLANMPEQQLNRWIKRIALLFVVVLIAFVAFYVADRFRMPAPTIADRELTTLEQAVRDDPADIASRGRLADLYLASERYDDAIAQYSEILASGKQDKAALVSRARALELKGDLPAAATDYGKVVAMAKSGEMANIDPVLELSYYGLGSIALAQDKPQDAIDNLLAALAIKRTDADAMNLLGAAYVKAGQADKAIEPLRKAVAFVPFGWPDPFQHLADAYKATGATEMGAWAAAMALLQADPTAAEQQLTSLVDGKAGTDARIGLGLLLETRGDTAGAADWYRKALALDAENESALLGLSRVTDGPAAGHPSIAPATPAPSVEGSN